MSVLRLVYTSRATSDMPPERVATIVAKSRGSNRAKDITGALLYRDRVFLQILEGPAKAVEALYTGIARDPRHADVRILFQETDTRRLFPDWSMGHPDISAEDLERLPGFNRFFVSGRSYADFGGPEIGALLEAFKRGDLTGQAA